MSAVPETTTLNANFSEFSLNKDPMQSRDDTAESTQPSSIAASLREKSAGSLKTPLVDPLESCKPTPAPTLTADQEEKYESLLEIVKSWKEVPAKDDKGGPIKESEIMWLTRECLLRYLRATKWHTPESAKRLLTTLTWRREFGVESFTADYISPENETGKQTIVGYDIAARPCHYLIPGNQNTQPSPRQNQHLVFMVERAIELMIPGQETLTLLIDFKSSKTRGNTAPPLSQSRECLNILQMHYPERLGRALITNVPWVVWGFFKLITPFIDPLTKEKLRFNEDLRLHVPPEQLWTNFQGDLKFEYDHETYWPALVKLCEERHAEQKARWIKGGKIYGESEAYIKGADVPSLGQPLTQDVKETEITTEKNEENEASGEKSPFLEGIPEGAEVKA
ncbi:hypothetical protein G7Y89_g10747 [Cudoniella acicularis]|uniref:CRAL-TRIO domain-containing protein n=1 Tax=Cudoniella acicularis TaxID=354080 RepID=A0A8H4W1A5_9HELO|nr:hypothetical protein G7Y89_g10747 [Cudoniella acicularis]